MPAKTFTYIPPHAHTQHRSTHNTPQKSPAPPEAGRRVTKHSKPCSKHAPTSKRAVPYYCTDRSVGQSQAPPKVPKGVKRQPMRMVS